MATIMFRKTTKQQADLERINLIKAGYPNVRVTKCSFDGKYEVTVGKPSEIGLYSESKWRSGAGRPDPLVRPKDEDLKKIEQESIN